ncbi:MAG: response regulator [Spirochaetia bacterium]
MKTQVLIVDDLSFVRKAIRSSLENAGFSIAGEAENGYECIRLLREKQPDIILLDITMPGPDGLTVLQKITSEFQNVKVIMCSALGQDKYIVKAIQLGAKDFVVKPFSSERIVSAVNKVASLG